MCGIAGLIAPGTAGERVSRMADALRHRGPDAGGVRALTGRGGRPAGAFGHRRLAILDLSTAGRQPMSTADGRYTLSFNGEIYNFRELRARLEREGARFRSESDTEVLLQGWARSGSAFLRQAEGMFAFALWDAEEERGYLARDSFGIKPLYWAEGAGGILFASELRAVMASGAVAPTLSTRAVRSYLATGSVAEPLSLVEGIRMLPAGEVAEIVLGDGAARVSACGPWGAPPEPAPPPERDPARAAALVRDALRASVERHLVSDVPVGLFLSGGIDSSALVGLAREVAPGTLDTFTVTFGEREFDEGPVARVVARRFGTRHHEVALGAADLLAALPEAFAAMDQPTQDGLNTYAVSRAVRAHGIKVVLSGLGGDEMFAGYRSFTRAERLARFQRLPRVVRGAAALAAGRLGGVRGDQLRLLAGAGSPARNAYAASRTLFGTRQVALLAGAGPGARLPDAPAGVSLLAEVSAYELGGYMRDTLLRDSDVFSMAHGLELRVPFVDRGVAAAAMSVADGLKLRAGISKPLLVDAVRDLLPDEVWNRPKRGFTLPFERWMRGELRGTVHAVLTSEHAVAASGLCPAAVRQVWDDFLARRAGMNWSRAWALYTLVRWVGDHGVELPPAGAEARDSRPARCPA